MTCDELRPDYVPFAMGVLDDPEKGEVRAHLDRGCEACTAGVREAQLWMYALGASAEAADPPKRLRKRILASVGAQEKPGWRWVYAWPLVTAAAVLALVIVGYRAQNDASSITSLHGELASVQSRAQHSAAETATLRAALNLLQAPETREVSFGTGKPAPPRGRVFVNPASGVLLVASNLPPAPAGKTYEMWIIPKGGQPAPAGLFDSESDGSAVHLYRTPVALSATAAIAVTLEAAGGVNAPTSPPVIAAAL